MSTLIVCKGCNKTLTNELNLLVNLTDNSMDIIETSQQASEPADLILYYCQSCWTKAMHGLSSVKNLKDATIMLELNLPEDTETEEEDDDISAQENEEMIQDKETATAEIENLMKKIKGLKQELMILEQNKDNLNSYIDKLRSESSSLIDKTCLLEVQCNELEYKKTKLEDEKKSIEADLRGLNETKEEFEEEKKSVDREKKRLNIHEDKQIRQFREDKVSSEDFMKFYDITILADTFYSLLQNKSWDIRFKDYQEYEKLKTQHTTKVAALGYENSGKSFVLSKLTGSELPQGTMMKTVGICMKYPTEKYLPWTALDTPGTNISVKVQHMKESLAKYFEEKNLSEEERIRLLLGDNILMENLLQEFVVKHAQVLLVVVGKLHRGDQKLINRIKKLPGKRIMIVHNLMDAQNKEDVEKIIQEDICQTFSVTEKPIYLEKIENGKYESMNTKVYLENDDKNDKAIEHIVMAHDGSPAGDYYNESAVYYIKTTITSIPFVESFDLVDAFLKYLNLNLKNYLHSKNTAISEPFILQKDKEERAPKALKLNDHHQYDLKLSSADEFGLIRTFVPEGLDHVPYTVKIVHEESDDRSRKPKALRFEFEIVGEYKDQNIKYKVHQCPNNQVRLEVKGKSEDNTIRSDDSILENTRKFGDFNILTDLIKLEGYVTNPVEKCKRIKSEVPGLMILEWNLYPPAEGSLD